jgi:hypothetical protein
MEKLWMISIFLPFYTIYMSFGRPIINVNTMKAVDASQQGQVSGWATTTQSIAQTLFPLVSTGILNLEGFTVGTIDITQDMTYWFLGILAALIGLILLVLLITDIQKYPKTFEKGPVPKKKPFNLTL